MRYNDVDVIEKTGVYVSELSVSTTPRLDYVACTSPNGLHRMAYWEWGDPHNPRVLLCVHGLTRTGRDFDELAQALSPYYRVICPDIVGRGQSDWLADPNQYLVPQYIADIFTLIARLKPTTLDWVGTSMGGLIGLGVVGALANVVHTSKPTGKVIPPFDAQWYVPFRRMILNDIGPELNAEGLARIGSYVDEELIYASFDEAVEQAKIRWGSFGSHTHEQWQALAKYVFTQQGKHWVLAYDLGIAAPFKKQFLNQSPEQVQASTKLGEQILWQAFESLPAEALIIRGQQSDLLSAEIAQQMLARNASASLYEVPNVGHAPTLIQKDQIEVVKQFLLKE